jgi:hypothetical protein
VISLLQDSGERMTKPAVTSAERLAKSTEIVEVRT